MKSTRADRRSWNRRPAPAGRRRHTSLVNPPGGESTGPAPPTASPPARGSVAPPPPYRGRDGRATPPAPRRRGRRLEPMTGLEPVTSSLPRTRSTTELHRLVPARAGTGAPADGRASGSRRPFRPAARILERETGIEPATNSLEGCDSTTELLPLPVGSARTVRRRAVPRRSRQGRTTPTASVPAALLAPFPRSAALARAAGGGEGRIRTSEAARATDLQSVAFDRSATSPIPYRSPAGIAPGQLDR